MQRETAARERVGLGVDDEVDVALAIKRCGLGAVTPHPREAQAAQHAVQCLGRGFVGREFDERHALEGRRGRRVEEFNAQRRRRDRGARGSGLRGGLRGGEALAHLAFQIEQRAHGVHRRAAVGRFSEQVVEDLQRQRPGVAGAQHLLEEADHVEIALAREHPVVAGPLQHVQRHERRIGHLHEENAVARNASDGRRVVAQREGVEAVQDQAQVRVVGPPDDVPGLAEARGVSAPGQRLIAHAQVAAGGALGQRVQLGGGQVWIVGGVRQGVGAAQHQGRAQFLHQVELALGALQGAGESDVGQAFHVAQGLVEVDRQSQIRRDAAQLGRRALEMDEVGLEQFDAVEAGGRDGLQLLAQGAAERDGGNGTVHRRSRHGGQASAPRTLQAPAITVPAAAWKQQKSARVENMAGL